MAYVLEDIIDRFNGPWEEIGSGDAPAANPPETVSGLGARPEASVIRGKGTGAIGTKTFRLRGGVWVADVDANATASDAASAYDEDVQEILAPPQRIPCRSMPRGMTMMSSQSSPSPTPPKPWAETCVSRSARHGPPLPVAISP